MNIESTNTATITKKSDVSSSASTTTAQSKDDTKSFKNQLEAVKGQDAKAEQAKTSEDTKNAAKTQEVAQNTKTDETIKTAQQAEADKNASPLQLAATQAAAAANTPQNDSKDKSTSVKSKTPDTIKNADVESSLDELNSRIATLSELKQNSNGKIQTSASKTKETDYCKTIKVDNNDTKFFLNLVDNQQMSAQNSQINTQINNQAAVNNNFTQIKSEATGQTVHVSAALMDAVNESFKTNKPLRIDFGNDIAVIMKVDKDGVLSANFIPGSAAVEAYLQNNIGSLRQNFDNQNLAYNELSYNKQQRQQQNQNRNKENENE